MQPHCLTPRNLERLVLGRDLFGVGFKWNWASEHFRSQLSAKRFTAEEGHDPAVDHWCGDTSIIASMI